ncbi:putative protein K02A2.6-like protein [Labeo rohita]|uniref:ribonuclease H n=1 Tax=Labeo rohita TaxID=84645 RepID=A0A498M9Q2_LABRO|nr:putative protein K02A2.6-like protein [Labeo rohita]
MCSKADSRASYDEGMQASNATSLEQYPIPCLEDLCSTLSGGKKFSKLDLSHAYQQVVVDEESQKFLTINTQRGLFTYQRLPFGVASAPAIFQRIMEGLVQGIPKVAVYLDDILITAVDTADQLENLGGVLKKLEDAGLRLKREKCVFLQDDVEYLGHRVNAHGLQPVGRKVKAIVEALSPSNVSELKAYLGLLNYYVAEKRYSQLDKEGLAVVLGIQKFHKYLYGRSFTICTDHKPLISLFNEKKPIPQMGSPRVQRWAVLLSAYDYTMVFRPGKANACADALSRLPIKDEETEEKKSEQVLMLDVLGDAPVNTPQIRRWTSRDVMMSRVREYILSGWPKLLEPELQPFHQR